MADPSLAELSDRDRETIEAWLVAFDTDWQEDALAAWAGTRLPQGHPLRPLALAEMVYIDLERQWQRGHRLTLDTYLKRYPELGSVATVSADLVYAEYQVRRQIGEPVELSELARRFPRQADQLARLIEQAGAISAGQCETSRPGLTADTLQATPTIPRDLPENFGRYRILKKLGSGGMGAVYLALDTKLDRQVALKAPHFSDEESQQAIERFLREARAAATIQHPNLCPVYDAGQIAGIHYMTMAYIEGHSLSDYNRNGKPITERKAAQVVQIAAMALQEAHARGIIHRDLKPANIMINQRGEPVIMDFGLARRQTGHEAVLTQNGTLMGTPAYMSPEQARGESEAVGPPSDIYSLGVILYEMLTGQQPFVGELLRVLSQVLTDEPKRPSELHPELAPELEEICMTAMAKRPEDRYAAMDDFAGALTEYLKQTSPQQAPDSAPTKPRPKSLELTAPGLQQDAPDTKTPARRDQREERKAAEVMPWWRDKRYPIAITAIALALPLLFWGVTLLLKTPDGWLEIKVLDDDVKLIVSQDGQTVTVIDTQTKARVKLRSGRYELGLAEGTNGVRLSANRFELHRGETKIVEVRTEPVPEPPVTTSATSQPTVLSAAQWVLAVGGDVVLKSKGRVVKAADAAALPAADFTVAQIGLSGCQQLRDADLALFRGLAELERIDLTDTGVTDEGLVHLREHFSLSAVHLHGTAVTDRGLEHLKGLTKLRGLGLTRTAITGSFLQHFQDHPVLVVLELDYCDLEDQALQWLRGLPNLDRLQFSHTRVTDAGFAHLRGLKKLRSLHANDTFVTDAGLEALEGLTELENLELCVTQVTDAGMKHVGKLHSLTRLLLKDTAVGDDGLRELQSLSKLEHLSLVRTQVADKGMSHLAAIPGLQRVDLYGNNVTPAGIAVLKTALPSCDISDVVGQE